MRDREAFLEEGGHARLPESGIRMASMKMKVESLSTCDDNGMSGHEDLISSHYIGC